MVALIGSSAPTHFQQILRTTAKHFALDAPDPELRLDRSAFVDPLPVRWPAESKTHSPGRPGFRDTVWQATICQ